MKTRIDRHVGNRRIQHDKLTFAAKPGTLVGRRV